MEWEHPLDAYAEAHFADGEGLANSATIFGDHDAFEDLRSFAATFDDPNVHLDNIAWSELGGIAAHVGAFDVINVIHV